MEDKRIKPLSLTPDEAVQNNIKPTIKGSNKISNNKGNDLSVLSNDLPKFNVGFEDIDEAIMYYFEEKIQPYITQNNQRVKVPIVYGDPEKWVSMQKYGFYRDKNGKLFNPMIIIRKSNIENNRNIGNKLDGNKPSLHHTVEQKYNRRNGYDNFSVLNNRNPEKTFIAVAIPDYVTITYDCIINTEYNGQINKIIEAINFTSDSYWGIPNKFLFKTKIDSYSLPIELNGGGDRIIKSNFTLIINGYIIPDTVNAEMVSMKGFNSLTNVNFVQETII